VEELRPVHPEGIWPASVSLHPSRSYRTFRGEKVSCGGLACITLSYRLLLLLHPPRARTSCCHGDAIYLGFVSRRRASLLRALARGISGRRGVPLVVLLEPLILGILPVSFLPAVVTFLGVPGAADGACIVLPWALVGGLEKDSERRGYGGCLCCWGTSVGWFR
jgi:hypothetical protein